MEWCKREKRGGRGENEEEIMRGRGQRRSEERRDQGLWALEQGTNTTDRGAAQCPTEAVVIPGSFQGEFTTYDRVHPSCTEEGNRDVDGV
ncbi:hypothetical protein EYF80_018823 [Liparis tanakae]|uniref:Uncharacterized protein n=1 Tax=Liparis tanakae TaxID=230148 RepID=A0A4Z2HZ48_9TELE|nr:hypothetical protein EYF80_018823 [Liparis tanakae]